MRIESTPCPRYDGRSDPKEWVDEMTSFFRLRHVDDEPGTRAGIAIAFLDGPAADWAELHFGFSDAVALQWAEWSRRLTDRFGRHDPSRTGKQLLSLCRKQRRLRAERAEKSVCTRRASTSASFLRRGVNGAGARRRVRWFDETDEDEDEDEAPEPELGRNRTTVSRPDGARRLEQTSRHLPTDAPEFATADAEDEALRQLPAGITILPVKKQEKRQERRLEDDVFEARSESDMATALGESVEETQTLDCGDDNDSACDPCGESEVTAAQDESMRTLGGYGDRDGNDSRECTCEPHHFSEPKPAELSGIRLRHAVVEFLDAELTIPWDGGCDDGLPARLPILSRWCEMSPRLSFQRRDLTLEMAGTAKRMEVRANDDEAEPCRSLFSIAAEEPRGQLELVSATRRFAEFVQGTQYEDAEDVGTERRMAPPYLSAVETAACARRKKFPSSVGLLAEVDAKGRVNEALPLASYFVSPREGPTSHGRMEAIVPRVEPGTELRVYRLGDNGKPEDVFKRGAPTWLLTVWISRGDGVRRSAMDL